MAKVRVGVIGVGAFGEVHVAAYQSLPEVELVAISDSRPGRLEEVEANVWHPRSLRRLLGALPPTRHRPGERRDDGIGHREPVLAPPRSESTCLENPIATSVGDAERMIEATARAGAFLMVGHVLRLENKYATVKRWISEGRLGKVASIHARHNRPKSQYRLYGDRIHGILVNSIHDIDLCVWYAGAPVSQVRAFTRNVQGGETQT